MQHNPALSKLVALVLFLGVVSPGPAQESLSLLLRYQQPTSPGVPRFHRLSRNEQWEPHKTAVILCDVWDYHHCVNAVRRVQELAPRIEQFATMLRNNGATVIHAPSACMDFYKDHPARVRAKQAPQATDHPPEIAQWCNRIPGEEMSAYPLDQSAGGEDDDLAEHARWAEYLTSIGRNARSPWIRQIDKITIDPDVDFISDSGEEIWNVLQSKGITNVMLVGVHTNMCVLGRPFGLRRLSTGGKNTVLVRDLTDTMYDPRAWPYANHFTGTDLIVDHIERYVCPTIASSQILGGDDFRFAHDRRPQLTMLIADDEYQTEDVLPSFAVRHLTQNFRVTICYGSDTERERLLSLDDIQTADALLVSVRRRWLPEKDMALIQKFVRSGKPLVGLRTASHAFEHRSEKPPVGYAHWPEFDAEAWGGHYSGHYGNDLKPALEWADGSREHPIIKALGSSLELKPSGSLYKTSPLAAGTTVLLTGQIPEHSPEPTAWTTVRGDGGRSFYTSLGHKEDFAQPQFEALLAAGIHWACGQPVPTIDEIKLQNKRFAEGRGRQ